MNWAVGASGLGPKALNRSSEIEAQCPQLKHSIAIRFIPPIGGMPKLPRSGQRAKLDIDQQVRLEPSRFRLFNLAG